jgi:hypothetical protein
MTSLYPSLHPPQSGIAASRLPWQREEITTGPRAGIGGESETESIELELELAVDSELAME